MVNRFDTGAIKTVMSENTRRSLGQPKLNKCDLILKTYSGEILKVGNNQSRF